MSEQCSCSGILKKCMCKRGQQLGSTCPHRHCSHCGQIYDMERSTDLHIFIDTKEDTQLVTLSPDLLYDAIHVILPKLLKIDGTNKTEMLMRTAVKGIFLMYGDKILEQIFKSKDHPKPQKGDDLVAWYMDLFTQIMIAQAMKSEYTVEVNETSEIVGCTSRPVPETATADRS